MTVDEVIEDNGAMPGDLELSDAVAADVACASDDEDVHEAKDQEARRKSQSPTLSGWR